MKKTTIIYWIFTILFAVFMTFTAIPDLLELPQAAEFMKQLGYPVYLLRFIGLAKLLGSIAIVIPGFPRIKEWAYAGLFFDLIGAAYSIMCVSGDIKHWGFMIVPVAVGSISYMYYHKKLSLSTPKTNA